MNIAKVSVGMFIIIGIFIASFTGIIWYKDTFEAPKIQKQGIKEIVPPLSASYNWATLSASYNWATLTSGYLFETGVLLTSAWTEGSLPYEIRIGYPNYPEIGISKTTTGYGYEIRILDDSKMERVEDHLWRISK